MENETQYTQADHTTLIKLDTKVDFIIDNVKDLKNGLSTQLAALSVRVGALEKMNDEISPVEVRSKTYENATWIHDFKIRWKFIVALAGAIGGIIAALLSFLVLYGQILAHCVNKCS